MVEDNEFIEPAPMDLRPNAPLIHTDENIAAEVTETDSILEKILLMFKNNKITLAAFIVLMLIILAALLAPVISPYHPNEIHLGDELKQPSGKYLLGTDEYGRDVLSRVIHGSRVSLIVGFVPTLISMTVGIILGLISGYFGGKIDFAIMRLADVVLAFPSFLLALLIMYTFKPGLMLLFIALSLVDWAGTARVVRSQTLSLKEKEFVEAAQSIGVKNWKIMLKHIFPNCLPSLIVLFTLSIPSSIMTESSLSFLGVGIQPPNSSWGLLVNKYKKYIFDIPLAALAPGVAILLVVLAFNFLGDGLRDAIDPYMKE